MKLLALYILTFFHQQASSFEVTCKYQSTSWSHIGQHYNCLIETLNVTEPSQFVTNVQGSHLSGYGVYDVKSVDIRVPGICNYVPLGLTNFFPNLKGLSLYNCKLKSLCSFDLVEFTNIVAIEFHYNQLTTLPSHLFRHNPHLKFLYASNNRLKFIHENIFDDLPVLEEAFFDNQICSGGSLTARNRNDVQYVVEKTILEKCQWKEVHEKCEDRRVELAKQLCSDEFPHVDERLRRKFKIFSQTEQ